MAKTHSADSGHPKTKNKELYSLLRVASASLVILFCFPLLGQQGSFLNDWLGSHGLRGSDVWAQTPEIQLDNIGAEIVGSWTASSAKSGYWASNYLWSASGSGADKVRWRPNLPQAGQYKVYYWLPNGISNQPNNAVYTVYFNGGNDPRPVNQELSGGVWMLLGQYEFAAGTGGYVELTDLNEGDYTLADAVGFEYVGGGTPAPVVTLNADPATITEGQSAVLTWSATNADSCAASGGWTGSKNPSGGTETVTPGATTTYTLECTGAGGSDSASVQVVVTPSSIPPIEIDNEAAEKTGTWSTSTAKTGYYPPNYAYNQSGTGADKIRWRPNIPQAGQYKVYYWLPNGISNQPNNAVYTVYYSGGSDPCPVNQELPGGEWKILGQYEFAAGTGGYVELTDLNEGDYTLADAVKFEYAGGCSSPSAPTLDDPAAGDGQVSLSWSEVLGVTGYRLYKRSDGGSYGAPVYEGSLRNFSDVSVTNGTTYYYRVTAYDSCGESVPSAEKAATPQASVPLNTPEDFTTYLETDPAGNVNVTAQTITFTNVETRNTEANVYRPYPEAAGDFVHRFDCRISAMDSSSGETLVWGLADTTVPVNWENAVYVSFYRGSSGGLMFQFDKIEAGEWYRIGDRVAATVGQRYYYTVTKTGNHLNVDIYSDENRTVLAANFNADFPLLNTYQNLFVFKTYDINATGKRITGEVRNLVLEDEDPAEGTEVSGAVTQNTTWTLAGSPYLVVGDVTVNPGITLTIEPGVVVQFDGFYKIDVKGKLLAQGTAGNLITFTSNKSAPAVNDWQALYLEPNLSGSTIDFCRIEFAQTGTFLHSTTLTISNSIYENNETGIHVFSSSLASIHDNTISDNAKYGITVRGYYDFIPNPTIRNNAIINNGLFNLYTDRAYAMTPIGSIIDARNNWWGSDDPVQIASKIWDINDNAYLPRVDFSFYLIAAPGQVINITENAVTDRFFNIRASESATIQYAIDVASDVTLKIYSYPADVLTRTLVNAQPRSIGAHSEVWDGKDDGGQFLPEGTYIYRIDAQSGDGKQGRYDPLFVSTPKPVISNVAITPEADFSPYKGDRLEVHYDIDTPAVVTLGVTGPAREDVYGTFIDQEPRATTGNVDYWDGRDSAGNIVDPGAPVYIERVVARLPENCLVIQDDPTLDISTLSSDPYSIRPLYHEVTTVTYSLNESAAVTVKILSPDGSQELTVLEQNVSRSAGTYTLTWDGRTDSGETIAEEGNYRIRLEAIDFQGKTVVRQGNITILY